MANSDARNKNKVIQLAGIALSKKPTGTATAVPSGYSGIEDAEETGGPVGKMRSGARAAVALSRGVVPSARLVMSAQPTDADTISIGGKTFTFVAALGAAGATVQVKIGGNAAATLASLVKAINGTTAALEWTEATTPFAGLVLADAVGTSLRIRAALTRGGTITASVSAGVALTEAITAAADVWNATNLNVAGKSEFKQSMTLYKLTLTALMLTTVGFVVELPFTPVHLMWACKDSTGAPKTITDTVAISGDGVLFAQAGATHAVAGDFIEIFASE